MSPNPNRKSVSQPSLRRFSEPNRALSAPPPSDETTSPVSSSHSSSVFVDSLPRTDLLGPDTPGPVVQTVLGAESNLPSPSFSPQISQRASPNAQVESLDQGPKPHLDRELASVAPSTWPSPPQSSAPSVGFRDDDESVIIHPDDRALEDPDHDSRSHHRRSKHHHRHSAHHSRHHHGTHSKHHHHRHKHHHKHHRRTATGRHAFKKRRRDTLIAPLRFAKGADANFERKVTWLELFYDIAYIAVINATTHYMALHPSLADFGLFVVYFAAVWWTWVSFMVYTNRFDTDDFYHRFAAFAQMAALSSLALGIGGEDGSAGSYLPWAYGALRVILAAKYARVAYALPEARPLAWFYIPPILISAVLWFGSVFIPASLFKVKIFLWVFALALDYGKGFGSPDLRKDLPVCESHLPERFGLFTIITLGETLLAVLNAAGDVLTPKASVAAGDPGLVNLIDLVMRAEPDSGGPVDGAYVWVSVLCSILTVCAMWWAYFEARPTQTQDNPRWIYLHALLHGSNLCVAAGLDQVIHLAANENPQLSWSPVLLVSLGMFVFLVAAGAIRLSAKLAVGAYEASRRARIKIFIAPFALLPLATMFLVDYPVVLPISVSIIAVLVVVVDLATARTPFHPAYPKSRLAIHGHYHHHFVFKARDGRFRLYAKYQAQLMEDAAAGVAVEDPDGVQPSPIPADTPSMDDDVVAGVQQGAGVGELNNSPSLPSSSQ